MDLRHGSQCDAPPSFFIQTVPATIEEEPLPPTPRAAPAAAPV